MKIGNRSFQPTRETLLKLRAWMGTIIVMKRSRARIPEVLFRGAVGSAIAVLALTGCVTKAKARAQAREAYLAGQQEAVQRQQRQASGGDVRINGQVQIPLLPWTSGLTLMKALVTAEYNGPDPTQIIVVHNGVARPVDVNETPRGRGRAAATGWERAISRCPTPPPTKS